MLHTKFHATQYNTQTEIIVSGADNFWNISNTTGTNIAQGPYIGGNYWNNYSWAIVR